MPGQEKCLMYSRKLIHATLNTPTTLPDEQRNRKLNSDWFFWEANCGFVLN